MQKIMISLILALVSTGPAFAVPRTEANCKASVEKAMGLVHQYVEKTVANPKSRKEAEGMLKGVVESAGSRLCKAVESKVPETSTMARDSMNEHLLRYVGVGNFTRADLLD